MDDRLLLQGIAVSCRLGTTEAEQAIPQLVWVDLELAIDAAAAAERDDLHDAVDYARLVAVVKEATEQRPVHLMETLAESLAAVILKEFGISHVRVRIKKRALEGIDYAAVEIDRSRGD